MIKVLIVDDSALVRQMLEEMLNSDPYIEVVGTADDPIDARAKVKSLKPDVLTLDIEMPKMDGITFLKNLMRLHPLPVVMVSTLTEKGAEITFEALDIGAVEFVTKPKINLENSFKQYALEIRRKVKIAAKISKIQLENHHQRYINNKNSLPKPVRFSTIKATPTSSDSQNPELRVNEKIIALGASTGGVEAIKEVLMRLPANSPPMVITQHIPAAFSEPFAKRMNTISEMKVYHAEDGQVIKHGEVYIAPGHCHLKIVKQAGKFICRLDDGPLVNRHKPSVDVMFRSVLDTFGSNSVAVILTGMGADGAQGMKELQSVGVKTVAQDEKTSVVWGMPGEATKIGAADVVLPLEKIPETLLKLSQL